jgi:arginase
MKRIAGVFILSLFFSVSVVPMAIGDESGKLKVLIVKDPYTDSRFGPEQLRGPENLDNAGLAAILKKYGCEVVEKATIKMPPELEREYGEWNRASLTNRILGKTIYKYNKGEVFVLGLLSGSKSLLGMLSGLQHLGPGRAPLKDSRGRDIIGLPRLGEGQPLRVGLVWIDAKGAFNTPDITLEGDMGGMNVAVAAGRCNTTLRLQAGLDPPLSTKYIVMAGVRDTNPYEQVHIDDSFIERISVDELRGLSPVIGKQIQRVSGLTDVIYVHVDLSVLDPEEIPGYPHRVREGPSSRELAACLRVMFKYPQVAALGIAAMPEEPEEISLQAANRLIEGAFQGIQDRGN